MNNFILTINVGKELDLSDYHFCILIQIKTYIVETRDIAPSLQTMIKTKFYLIVFSE
jgi:hypothetical protein